MKKLVIVFAVALFPLAGFSQSLFDKYEDMDNVAAVIVKLPAGEPTLAAGAVVLVGVLEQIFRNISTWQ